MEAQEKVEVANEVSRYLSSSMGEYGCRTRFVRREAPNPEKNTQNPQFVPMEELKAIKPARDN